MPNLRKEETLLLSQRRELLKNSACNPSSSDSVSFATRRSRCSCIRSHPAHTRKAERGENNASEFLSLFKRCNTNISYLLAKIAFGRADNEPSKSCQVLSNVAIFSEGQALSEKAFLLARIAEGGGFLDREQAPALRVRRRRRRRGLLLLEVPRELLHLAGAACSFQPRPSNVSNIEPGVREPNVCNGTLWGLLFVLLFNSDCMVS